MTKDTEVNEDQPASFDDALANNLAEAENAPTGDSEAPDGAQVAELMEAPEFWSDDHKELFKQLQQLENGRTYAEGWVNNWKDGQKYITQKSQKLAEERRQYEQQLNEYSQFQQAFAPLRDIAARTATPLPMMAAQLAHYGQMLHQNPQAVIEELANAHGVDLNKLIEDKPFIHPAVESQLRELRQQNQQFQQTIAQSQQAQAEQQQKAQQKMIDDFRSATDADGKPLHPFIQNDNPHKQTVEMFMAGELTNQFSPAKDLAEAYQRAVALVPEVQEAIAKEKAAAQAAAQAQQVQKVKQAAVKTPGKTTDAPPETLSFEDRLMRNLEKAAQ